MAEWLMGYRVFVYPGIWCHVAHLCLRVIEHCVVHVFLPFFIVNDHHPWGTHQLCSSAGRAHALSSFPKERGPFHAGISLIILYFIFEKIIEGYAKAPINWLSSIQRSR